MIIVTGGNGQLAQCLKKLLGKDTVFLTKQEFDITDIESMDAYLSSAKTKTLINTAAFTNVDACEEMEKTCLSVNAEGPKNLALLSEKHSFKLIHISTDYVFEGVGKSPLKETGSTNPINKYGHSKLMGELAIKQHASDYVIIRTSWLFSEHGNNFVTKMLELLKEKTALSVVDDQIGSPTYALDLGQAITQIIDKLGNDKSQLLLHYANRGQTSWYEFAQEINHHLKTCCQVKPIPTIEYRTPAARPRHTVLDTYTIEEKFRIVPPQWKESLEKCLNNII